MLVCHSLVLIFISTKVGGNKGDEVEFFFFFFLSSYPKTNPDDSLKFSFFFVVVAPREQKMSGQSITDRITAAQHSVTGSAVSKTVCKATTHEVMGPKKKHLDCEYLSLFSSSFQTSVFTRVFK